MPGANLEVIASLRRTVSGRLYLKYLIAAAVALLVGFGTAGTAILLEEHDVIETSGGVYLGWLLMVGTMFYFLMVL